MTILERIDELRSERGWSVNYLAMEAMLTQSTVNNLYARNAEPKLSTLRAICNAFGITLAEFFSYEKEEDASPAESEIKRRISAMGEEQKSALLVLLRSLK